MIVDPAEVETWLEWAGQRLIAMPGPRVGPSESTGWWPDYSQDQFEILEFRAKIALRVAAPAFDEIGLMEDILLLPGLIKTVNDAHTYRLRKIVRKRTVLHPISDRHLWSWTRLSTEFKKDIVVIKRWYNDGLENLSKRIEDKQAMAIKKQFELAIGRELKYMAISPRSVPVPRMPLLSQEPRPYSLAS